MIHDAYVPILTQPPNLVGSVLASAIISSMLIFDDVSGREVFGLAVHQQHCHTIRLLNQALSDPAVATQPAIINAVSSIMVNHVSFILNRSPPASLTHL